MNELPKSKYFSKKKVRKIFKESQMAGIEFLGSKNKEFAIKINQVIFPKILKEKEKDKALYAEYDELYETYEEYVLVEDWKKIFLDFCKENISL